MDHLVDRLAGPYFDFLVLTKDEYWERRGRVQRKVGIRAEYYHRADALRIPDCVVSLVEPSFAGAHPRFNYYGDTEFYGEELDRLLDLLRERIAVIRACRNRREFYRVTTGLFRQYCHHDIGTWHRHWPAIRYHVAARLDEIVERGETAQKAGKVLLVLGI